MSKWKIFSGTNSEWDDKLIKYNSHYRQSTIWGNLKNKKNWNILRVQCNSDTETSIQILYKKYFFITFFFFAGGPIGSITNLDQSLINFIVKYTKSHFYYIRLDDGSFDKNNLEYLKFSKIWSRPLYRMNNSKCAFFSLADVKTTDDIFINASRDFKSNLKKASKKTIKYIHTNNPNSNDLVEISISMFNKKKLKMMEFSDFENFKETLGKFMHYFIAYDENNIPLAYRAILIFENKAWDIAAATSTKGRKTFAGFGVIEEVIKKLLNLSVEEFNLGALTAKSDGINSFKIGTGAKERFYVGEFETSNLIFLKTLVNFLITISLSKNFITFNFLRRLYF